MLLKKCFKLFTAFLFTVSLQSELNADIESYQMAAEFDRSTWTTPHDLFIIHSIPKCGTHFIQKVVNLITNQEILEGSPKLEKMQKACKNNQVLRIHQRYSRDSMGLVTKAEHKVIAMVRDPRDALISHVFYMRTFKKGVLKRDFFNVGSDFDTLTLEEQITSLIVGDKYADSYIDYYKERTGWALAKGNLYIKFEELAGEEGGGSKELQKQAIEKIAKYIKINLSNDNLEFVLNSMYTKRPDEVQEGKTFKRGSTGNWKTFLTKEQIKLIKAKLGKQLIQLGYEKDMNW
ncbi:MAG: sulfotransferase domain-containing protein [Parachlamydiaceae bacterium]|nr:sulfotransferase domain-containing protein [Parachlamydiaceae bacterium]